MRLLLIPTLAAFLVLLLGGFISMEINPFEWTRPGRISAVMFWAIFSLLLWIWGEI